MAIPMDFILRKTMDNKLSNLGVAIVGSKNRSNIDITTYNLNHEGSQLTEMGVHLSTGTITSNLDDGKTWVTGQLTKIPYDSVTRGPKGLNHKKGIYTVMVRSPKQYGEYVNEALSAEIEKYFTFNEHITSSGELITVLETSQQPTVFLDGKTGRYWNRIFINCEIYYNNN